ncbi:hypothetical protein B0S90_2786 [Caldicellulosiruptor bescii]|uniref:DUF7768 domain-containing protein n=2 Tax=Caldicellulosiruptor bescii TaxID=31899 RepID=B9MNI1_CALBD|nr:DUF4406 domain-containing protein [Caldicellulosiruptor bescii]ACM61512.1 conserved hypothetical protein [Caldicellulosiruptor bescii DSM 6725]PBC88676.1 hypothetical protein B0S87_1705 [Caldicellulosiruptor bescii]PBC91843.1 hypothetical protein B0S89_2288 [Caldicellulosiruptor bescii]PBD02746.1 hypothetical protein B0S85_0286 [Caldicellulosiruptor bescii]PBD07637.1 hypothetical protein B0S90_2786 [Caldicellulosiruptor bescii]
MQNFRLKVYICSPYRDNPEENRQKALQYCRKAFDEGYLPIAPHVYFPQFLDENTEREQGLEMALQLLLECQELWVFGPEITEGMKREIEFAKKFKIPIKCFYFRKVEEVKEILKGSVVQDAQK